MVKLYTCSGWRNNLKLAFILWYFRMFKRLSSLLGYKVQLFTTSTNSLELYYHEDHPGMLLVDKDESGF